jgi:CRP-like cAMP-binding protein
MLLASEEIRNALIRHGDVVELKGGTTLFEEGKQSTGIYLILSGSVETKVWSAMPRIAAPGSLLGVPATINGTPYSITSTLLEDSTFVRVSRPQLIELMRSTPSVAFAIIEMLSTEVREMRMHMKAPRTRSVLAN